MRNPPRIIALGGLLLGTLAACQSLPGEDMVASQGEASHPSLALAQGACGGCHAVERYTLSPLAAAPPFAAIVNRNAVTGETLEGWLRDAHNYPEEMDFHLDQAEIDALVDYMLTLRDPAYEPIVG